MTEERRQPGRWKVANGNRNEADRELALLDSRLLNVDCTSEKAWKGVRGTTDVRLSPTVLTVSLEVRILEHDAGKPPGGTATIKVVCSATDCAPTPATLPTMPTQFDVEVTDKWNCTIAAGSDQWRCDEKKSLTKRQSQSVQLLLTSSVDPTHVVKLPVSEPEPERGTFLPALAAVISTGVAFFAGILVLLTAVRASRLWAGHEADFANQVNRHCTEVSAFLSIPPSRTRKQQKPSTPVYPEPRRTDHDLRESITAAIRAADDCISTVGANPIGVREAVRHLQALTSGKVNDGARVRDGMRTLAKLTLAEVDSAGSLPRIPGSDAEAALTRLLDIAGLATFTPRMLDRYDDYRHEQQVPSEMTTKQENEGCIAKVKRRGLLDTRSDRVVAKALVVLYARA